MKIKFEENIVPGDGNCLFRSLGIAFKIPHNQLRIAIAQYLEKNKRRKFNGLALEEWVKMETDMDVERYCRYIRDDGIWGGNMEINVASKMFKVNIFVLSRNNEKNKYDMISSYVFDNNARNVFLVYDGVHYNYLKVKGDIGIKT